MPEQTIARVARTAPLAAVLAGLSGCTSLFAPISPPAKNLNPPEIVRGNWGATDPKSSKSGYLGTDDTRTAMPPKVEQPSAVNVAFAVDPASTPNPMATAPMGPETIGAAKAGPAVVSGPVPRKDGTVPTPIVPFDSHSLEKPTASGGLLELKPNESGVEKAVELAEWLRVSEAEKRGLANRLRSLEEVLETRERMIRDDEVEMSRAAQEVAQVRAELLRLRSELDRARQKQKLAEQEDLELLRLVVDALQKYLEANQ